MKTTAALLSILALACGGQATSHEASNTSPEVPAPEEHATVAPTPEAEEVEEAEEAMPTPTHEPAADLASAIDALGVDLYQRIRGQEGNLAFSPASISLAFGMTWAGAAGDTASEMANVLHYPGPGVHADAERLLGRWNGRHQGLTLRVVDRLFGEQSYTFEAPFLALTRDRYHAPIERVNFRSAAEAQRAHINAWVAEQTEQRIDELLPAGILDSLTRLVLVNAVYFLGEWVRAFDPAATTPASFSGPSGSVTAQMMHQTASFRFGETDDAQVLEMTYRGGAYAMLIVLPKNRRGLEALEASMDVGKLAAWQAALTEQRVEVFFPRFTIDGAKLDLKEILPAMGMRRAFSAGLADFSNMARPTNPEEELYIAAAVHEAFVEVGEEGTEAAAATAVVMAARGGRPPPQAPVPVFRADHPFVFAIRDTQADTTLFLGRVVDPS